MRDVAVVIPAGGVGRRLGSRTPKQFLRLGRASILALAAGHFARHPAVSDVVVAAPAEHLARTQRALAGVRGGARVQVVAGGVERQESVWLGMQAVPDSAAVIVVHDAARPVLTDEVLERVLTALNEGWDGAVPALPLADTIKRVQGERVVETLPRDELVAAQTPQAFLASALREALSGELAGATDCAALVEALGLRVTAVPGDPRLLKVTDSADLELIAGWL